jgi:hypothetical protein
MSEHLGEDIVMQMWWPLGRPIDEFERAASVRIERLCPFTLLAA